MQSLVYTVSQGKHEVNVMGRTYIHNVLNYSLSAHGNFATAAAAEKALEITRSLIDLAKIENDLSKELTVYVSGLDIYFTSC